MIANVRRRSPPRETTLRRLLERLHRCSRIPGDWSACERRDADELRRLLADVFPAMRRREVEGDAVAASQRLHLVAQRQPQLAVEDERELMPAMRVRPLATRAPGGNRDHHGLERLARSHRRQRLDPRPRPPTGEWPAFAGARDGRASGRRLVEEASERHPEREGQPLERGDRRRSLIQLDLRDEARREPGPGRERADGEVSLRANLTQELPDTLLSLPRLTSPATYGHRDLLHSAISI